MVFVRVFVMGSDDLLSLSLPVSGFGVNIQGELGVQVSSKSSSSLLSASASANALDAVFSESDGASSASEEEADVSDNVSSWS